MGSASLFKTYGSHFKRLKQEGHRGWNDRHLFADGHLLGIGQCVGSGHLPIKEVQSQFPKGVQLRVCR